MNRTTLIRIGIALGALVTAATAYAVWRGAVMDASAVAASLATQITVDGARSARVIAAKTALASLAHDEVSVSRYFVSNATLVPFLESLQSAASALGAQMTITSVSADTENARQGLTVHGSLSGSFDAVMRAVGAIEYAPYYVSVDQLSLSNTASADTAHAAAWNALFTLTVGTRSATTDAASATPRTTPRATSP